MEETKRRYYEAMHDATVKQVVLIECQETCNEDLKGFPPFKLAGRTDLYPKYLKNRCAVKRQYYLPHRLMRNIVAKTYTLMPRWICDFGRYRKLGYLDFNRLYI